MAKSPVDIDQIVRNVLAQLGMTPGGTAGTSTSATGAAGGLSTSVSADERPPALLDRPPVPPDGHNDLVISARVVTLSELEGRLDGVQRLVVPPGAVVTPAVRDELRRRNVTLAHASPPAARDVAGLRLVMINATERFDPAPLVTALANEGVQLDQQQSDCLIAAVDRLAAELAGPHTLGLLLTQDTAAALCLANRLRAVRAVSGTDPGEVAAAAASVGANLLVIDPVALGPFQLRQITIEFCRAGTRQCPRVFIERLA